MNEKILNDLFLIVRGYKNTEESNKEQIENIWGCLIQSIANIGSLEDIINKLKEEDKIHLDRIIKDYKQSNRQIFDLLSEVRRLSLIIDIQEIENERLLKLWKTERDRKNI